MNSKPLVSSRSHRSAIFWRRPIPKLLLFGLLLFLAACGGTQKGEQDVPGIAYTSSYAGASVEASNLDGSTVSGTITAFIPADSIIENVRYFLDDPRFEEPVAVFDSAPFEYQLDTTELADGEHTLTAQVDVTLWEETTQLVRTARFRTDNRGDNVLSSRLVYSLSENRSNPKVLDGATLSGNVYIFTGEWPRVEGVRFYLDDEDASGSPYIDESAVPFDFAGTADDGSAVAFDTGELKDGDHSITAVARLDNGESESYTARFTVGEASNDDGSDRDDGNGNDDGQDQDDGDRPGGDDGDDQGNGGGDQDDGDQGGDDDGDVPGDGGNGAITIYPVASGEQTSDVFEVSVGGDSLPVVQHESVHYVHFAADSAVRVTVDVSRSFGDYTVSPLSQNIRTSESGNSIEVVVEPGSPVALHEFGGFDDKLFIFVDETVTGPSGGSVVNVRDFDADASGSRETSAAFNRAVDAVSGSGGTVVVPAGTYLIEESIDLESNVNLYLAPGALLQMGERNKWDYMVKLENGSNMSLTGHGTIDANGIDMRNAYDLDSFAPVRITDCTGCSVEGVILRNSPRDHINIKSSPNAEVRNVKFITDAPFENTDGLHFGDGSSGGRASDLFIFVTDDPLTVGYRSNIEDVEISDSVLWTNNGAAFRITTRIGSGLDYVRDVTLRDIDVVASPRLIHLQPTGGGTLSNLQFIDIRAETIGNRLFDIHNDPWDETTDRYGEVRNVLFSNVTVDDTGSGASTIYSVHSGSEMANITFEDLVIEGQPISSAAQGNFEVGDHVSNLSFDSGSVATR